MQEKIASARAQGRKQVIKRSDVVFTTEEPTEGRASLPDVSLADWDSRLQRESKPDGVRR